MKKIAVILLLLCGLFTIGFAQSGRKARGGAVSPSPSPTPVADEDGGYSDSVPGRITLSRTEPSLRRTRRESNSPSDPKAQSQTSTATNGEATASDDGEILRVETNLVTVPVSVLDRNGIYIPNLRRNDFKIFEDGKEQEISHFGTTEQPFTVVLLLDTSPSTRYKIEEIQAAATSFVNQLQAQDAVMVIEFDEDVNVLAEPTNDREKLYKAIRRADFGNGTSLYDAVDYAVRKRLSKIPGKKAVVLFTDGVDTTSFRANYDSTVRGVEESDTIIFPVHYDTLGDVGGGGGVMTSPYPPGFPIPGTGGIRIGGAGGITRRDYEIGRRYLEELATHTGGRVFYPKWQGGGLEAAFAGIAEELRRQYSIGYYPENSGQNGQRKQVKVRVNRPNLVVRARGSYVVGANETAPTPPASKE